MKHRTATIFCIGRELLEGLVLDRNAHFMAERITRLGFRVRTIQVLDDVEEEMTAAFKRSVEKGTDYVFTTGGMGPGHDDITRQAVAKAAGVSLVRDPVAMEMLSKAYRRLKAKGLVEDAEIHDQRAKMAEVPEGAELFENPMGSAPAVRLSIGQTTFFLLPGVPEEMQRMFSLYVQPQLQADSPGAVRKSRTIEYDGRDESAISRLLDDLSRRHKGVHCRARVTGAGEGLTMRITLFGEHSDERELEHALDGAEADLRARLGIELMPDAGGSSEHLAE